MSVTRTTNKALDSAAIDTLKNTYCSSAKPTQTAACFQIVGEQLAETLDLHPQATVLDVAAGKGNAALAFARRWNSVTSTDQDPAALDCRRAKAEAEDLTVDFKVAHAEALPFENESFDAVVSTFGVIFSPDQQRAAQELTRVCRPGGQIGLANWTPNGFIGQLLTTIGRHVPAPPGIRSSALWGSESWISATFGDAAISALIDSKSFVFRYACTDHFLEILRTYCGPVHKAFLSLDPQGQSALAADLTSIIANFNTARDGSVRVPGDYLEVIIEKA